MDDKRWMRAARLLGRQSQGRTADNPAVGCVIVKDNTLVARGRTGDGGRPHAETIALAAGKLATKNATAYITLEPCAHQAQTPPCAEALIKAGIKRVVVGMLDPDKRVNGEGLARLKQCGIEVTQAVLADDIGYDLAGYSCHRQHARAFCAVKIATSLDGRIALANSSNRPHWITGAAARHYVHDLRSRYQAVMTASGTLTADNPRLTARLAGISHQPLRVLLTSHVQLNKNHALWQTASDQAPVLIVTSQGGKQPDLPKGVDWATVPADNNNNNRPQLPAALRLLATRGIQSVLVEGGATLLTALVRENLIDRLYWFHAAKLIGNDGIAAIAGLGLTDLAAAPQWRLLDERRFAGGDLLRVWGRG